jgi:hypothetical protein
MLSPTRALTRAPGRALRCAGAALAALALAASLPGSVSADEIKPDDAARDWPCKQILVDQVSLPAIWSGPAIEGADWRGDGAVSDLVAQLAARKTPLDAAERAIDALDRRAGAEKAKKLTALFAGLFETLNSERGQIIDGLSRLGRKQKALAAKIRAENAEFNKSPAAATPQGVGADDPLAQKLELDLRAFDEGRRSISYACEAPTLVEQRLFALARMIQNRLD